MKKIRKHPDLQLICAGTGLIALDVLINNKSKTEPTQFYTGGSCGNVLAILAYMGWDSFPIARLSNNQATSLLLEDLTSWGVKFDLLEVSEQGSTPIIIHRILENKHGESKHRFEFKNPENGTYLPSYKPCLAKSIPDIVARLNSPDLFYFDRINRGAINLAKSYRECGAMVFFEPSSAKDISKFKECVSTSDILKFSEDRINDYETIYEIAEAPLEIQTLGDRGLKFRRKGESAWHELDVFKIDDVADTAGAGDWLTAGIISMLFKQEKGISELTTQELVEIFRFGQVLSAMNCTFEGARGLMYNISRSDLIFCVNHVLTLTEQKIPKRAKPEKVFQPSDNNILISSLF